MHADDMDDDRIVAAAEAEPTAVAPIAHEEAAPDESPKTCCICGRDVSQQQRARDRSGRYWCTHCEKFPAGGGKTPGFVPCPDCGRDTRDGVLVEQAGERVCPFCHQNYVADCQNRLLHKAAVSAHPELEIRRLIAKLTKGLLGLAAAAALLALYHYHLLYYRPKAWVPFKSILYVFGSAAFVIALAIGVQYLRIAVRQRMRETDYDKMIRSAVNQVLALDEDTHSMGISESPEPLRRRVERAMLRTEACAGLGMGEAGKIIDGLAKNSNAVPLIAFLSAQRPGTSDTVARNRELATISYLQVDLATASSAVTAILLRLPNDQDAMTRQALICFRNGDLEQAKKIFKRVVFTAKEKKSEIDLAAAFCNLGMLHVMLNEFDDADVRYSQAIKIYNKLNREEGQADCLVNLGLIGYKKKVKGMEVEDRFRKAMAINKRLKRREGMAICCSLLGVILIEKETPELNEADKLLKRAAQFNIELGRASGVATAYGNLGLVRVKRGDLAGARELFFKAQAIYQRINRPKMMAKIQGMLKTVGTLSAAQASRK